MQEASGDDFTNCNWCAQPSSADLAAKFDSHSFPRISYSSLVRAIAPCTDVLAGAPVVRPSSLTSRTVPAQRLLAGARRPAPRGARQAVRAAVIVKI